MNLEKVNRVIELQIRANHMIDKWGEAEEEVVLMLMDLVDELTPEESDKLIELSHQINF